jgi:hypothetical protein
MILSENRGAAFGIMLRHNAATKGQFKGGSSKAAVQSGRRKGSRAMQNS